MKNSIVILVIFFGIPEMHTQEPLSPDQPIVREVSNAIFTSDKYWRGADGAATVDLGNGRVLWLFSDTFIDRKGTGQRQKSTMVRNSIAIQQGYDLATAEMTFYYRKKCNRPKAFFDLPGKNWLWTGHGIRVNDQLVIFLFELEDSNEGLGFQSVGWHEVIIDNPDEDPLKWNMRYYKGPDQFQVLVGSSAVLREGPSLLVYGVGYYNNDQDVYLLRYDIDELLKGNLSSPSWWVHDNWVTDLEKEPKEAVLFQGQTEFSVHYLPGLDQYIQIQAHGFGHAALGYRLASQPQGPWSDPVIFYKPQLKDDQEFVYSANAHPELKKDGILITYNINHFDFWKLVNNERIYFPRMIYLRFK